MALEAAAIGGILSLFGGSQSNSANREIAREQMAFQREMSNTSHQREVKDLRAAGLNPVLSAKLGGASTPPGAGAQMQDIVTPAVSTAIHAGRAKTEVEMMQQTLRNLEATEKNIASDTVVKKTQAALNEIGAEAGKYSAKAANYNQQLLRTQIPEALTHEEFSSDKWGKGLNVLKRITNSLSGGFLNRIGK